MSDQTNPETPAEQTNPTAPIDGVSAAAVAGLADGTPATTAVSPAALAALAVGAADGLPTIVTDPVHDDTIASDADTTMHGVPDAEYKAILEDLKALEQLALFMGGETGVDIRNRVCRVRLALTGYSHSGDR